MGTTKGSEMIRTDPAAAYWHAVAMLRLDRPAGLAELEHVFASGGSPSGMDGVHRGRLIATTFGRGLDGPFESAARAWMPWRGKTFDLGRSEGRNVFTPGGRRVLRVSFPGYAGTVREPDGGGLAFRFVTDAGPSETVPGLDVLRIDYRGLEDNPNWPIRRILDELVEVASGLYLGQALLLVRGRFRRAAWFSLEA